MFHHKQSLFTRWARTYPILKSLDIYDRQSFIREYVLDNAYLSVFMYFLFYVAVFYATKAIKRIERKNKKLMETVVGNRTKLDDVMALKDKRAEYEDIVVKAKGAQKVTAKHLDNEMKRLSTELIATGNKMAELERILGKMLCSVNSGKSIAIVGKEITERGNEVPTNRQRSSRTRSRTSRSSNRRFHQRYHRSHRHGSTVSLSRDHQVNVCHRSPALQRRKSDSSNRASAETSSNDSHLKSLSRVASRCKCQQEITGKRSLSKKRSRRISISRKNSLTSLSKSPFETSKATPLEKSILAKKSVLQND